MMKTTDERLLRKKWERVVRALHIRLQQSLRSLEWRHFERVDHEVCFECLIIQVKPCFAGLRQWCRVAIMPFPKRCQPAFDCFIIFSGRTPRTSLKWLQRAHSVQFA